MAERLIAAVLKTVEDLRPPGVRISLSPPYKNLTSCKEIIFTRGFLCLICKTKNYLALPYSHSDPLVREVRYGTATSVAAYLMKQGAVVFSPIIYGHQICRYGIDTNFKRWAELDYPMITRADDCMG